MSNAQIVIVDANAKTLKDVARVLAQAGYEVTTATSGREGERVVASCRPHLVLLDFVLPDIPGTEVLRRIKADPASNSVSVVLMSSLFGTTLEHSADLDADADGYIVRPISSRELLARVRGILRQRELVHSLRASESRYRDQAILFSNAQRMGHMGSWSLDIADERMVWSDETCALFGIAPDEFRGTREHFYSFVLPEDRPRLNADYSRVVTSGGLLDVESEFRIRRPDGQVRWMMVRGNAHLDADGSIGRRFGMYMDITDRKHAEERILRLNRVYALLSALSAVLPRIPDREHLFDTACRIAVDTGKMHAAWIGLLDADTGEARMAAQAGNMRDYHKEIRVSGAIGPFGGGPFGVAMREGRSVVCNDIENDPTFAPWRDSALKRGFKSMGIFPLKLNGRTFGGYAHYADVPDFFDAEEIRLLDELAANISFAVEYLEKEQRRQAAEAALRESEERLRAIYEQAAVGICLISLDYRFERVNRRFCEILGCDADRLLNFASSADATHPDDRETDARAIAKLLAGATSITLEKRYLTRENQVVWVRLTLSVLRSPQGDPRKFIGVIEDISARQALEEQLRRSQRLESVGQLTGGVAHDFNNLLTTTILLVEDDEMVRRLARDQLSSLGYQVIEAANGPQALELIRGPRTIDLLFTDVVMPGGMSGRQLSDEASKLRPTLKVLYTSGYAENAIVHHGRLDPGVQLLGKPYRRAELAKKIRDVLA